MKPGTLVEVELDDMEHVSHGWQSFEFLSKQDRTAYRCAGYLISKSKHWTVIGSVTNSEAHAFCAFRIPTGAVRSMRRLDRRSRSGASIVRRQPPGRVVTSEVVQHLVDGGASGALIDYARRHVDQ